MSLKNKPGILVSSISAKVSIVGLVRVALERVFENDAYVLWGADASPLCVAKMFVDKFWQMPLLSELSIESFIEFCLANNIQYVIPSRDGELTFYARNRDVLGDKGIYVMVSPFESITTCVDKALFSECLKKDVGHFIETSNNLEDISSEVITVKPQHGSGSKGLGIALTREEALVFSQSIKDPIFQQHIVGREFSADLFVNNAGISIGPVLRWRDLVVDGESKITTTFRNESVEAKTNELAVKLGLYGHAVVQGFITDEGELFFIEVNCRIGGASYLGFEAGLKSIDWFLLESLNKSVEYDFQYPKTALRLVRYAKDEVYELGDE